MIAYPVILTPDSNGTLLVTSPDFPELTSFGDTLEDALEWARGALLEAPDGLLHGEGEMMRYVTISTWKEVKEDLLKALVRQAVLLNQRLGDPTKR